MNWSRRFGTFLSLTSLMFVASLTLSNYIEFRVDPGRIYEATISYQTPGLSDVLKSMAAIEIAVPRMDGASPARSDVLFASQNQPGQDWRTATDAYRHIDPGRRVA